MNNIATDKEINPALTKGQDKIVKQALTILHSTMQEKLMALNAPSAVRDYLTLQLSNRPNEVFVCLFLDCQHRLIAFESLFYGTIDAACVYPREVVRRCLHHNAAAVILAHNHPSGVAEPSQADRRITERLVNALALVDIRVLDHFVVGDSQLVSFAERGLL